MRIISGRFGSRRIVAPKGLDTRPTLDRTRESLFNVLQGGIADARVLDLFAGSGSLGLEALSRGASFCVFCDKNREAVKALYKNISSLDAEDMSRVMLMDYLKAIDQLTHENEYFHLMFLDPPYVLDGSMALEKIASKELLRPDGLIVFERDAHAAYTLPQGMSLKRSKKYGRTVLDFIIWSTEE